MTTESMGAPHATMSHPWGTSPVGAIAHGVVGVQQTAAAWAAFTVKPRLATLRFANLTLPTIRGSISVAAAPGRLEVGVPCNTQATLCLDATAAAVVAPAAAAATPSHGAPLVLLLDGERVEAVEDGRHLCTAAPVGCAAAPRTLRTVAADAGQE
jgi:hypothetical protein